MSSSRSKGSSKVRMRIIFIKFYTNSNNYICVCVLIVLIVIWLSKVTYKAKMQIYIDRHVYGKYVCIWNWDMDQREQLAWLSTKDRWLNRPQALWYAVSSQLMSISLVLWYLLKYKNTTIWQWRGWIKDIDWPQRSGQHSTNFGMNNWSPWWSTSKHQKLYDQEGYLYNLLDMTKDWYYARVIDHQVSGHNIDIAAVLSTELAAYPSSMFE